MRVLFHKWEYPPGGAGIGRYVEEMSSALRERGHFTVVVTSRGPGQPERMVLPGGVICYAYERSDIGSRHAAGLVLEIAREFEVDCIEGADHLGESADILSRMSRPPVMIKLHYNDVVRATRRAQVWYPWQHVTIALACWRDRARLRRERYSIEAADGLVAPCQRLLQELQTEGVRMPRYRGILANPIRIPRGWVNEEFPVPSLLFVGRLDFGKGVGYLPGLIRRVRQEVPSAVLRVAGGDSYARFVGSMRKWCDRHLMPEPGMQLLGPLPLAALQDELRRAWVVVAPSRWDTFSTVVLEAMARGKAIVGSPHGGMPEMLRGTGCPIAEPASPGFAEHAIKLLMDAEARRVAGEGAAWRAQSEYAPERIARAYEDLVGGMIKRGAGGA